MSDLYFVGGKFGAYLGNQQFTASGLYFSNCETAIQIHWDWGWTMQNIAIDNCGTGIAIVGGAGKDQGAGSLALTDMIMSDTDIGIKTSLMTDKSTSFLLMNSKFTNVNDVVIGDAQSTSLFPGGLGDISVAAWGFGRVTDDTGSTTFVDAQDLPILPIASSLVREESSGTEQNFFFTRRRPSYRDLSGSQLFDVKEHGAGGDGSADDAVVLNYIMGMAANLSAIVYFPFRVYMVSDTVQLPLGSRVTGQAWPQLMGYGAKFEDTLSPRPVVRLSTLEMLDR